jgi:hypothetical protein
MHVAASFGFGTAEAIVGTNHERIVKSGKDVDVVVTREPGEAAVPAVRLTIPISRCIEQAIF